MVDGSPERQSFIAEPLLFFDQDVEFRSAALAAERANVPAAAEAMVASMIERGNTEDPEELHRKAHRASTRHAFDNYYERSFRGRYIPEDLFERHSQATEWVYKRDKSGLEYPGGDTLSRLMNDALSEELWMTAFENSYCWYSALEDDHPDKQIAANYAGYAGTVLINQYIQLARSMADPMLSNDWFVRTKHLLTICWPAVRDLEPIIPDEIAKKKQLLREIMLEFASQDNTGELRRYVDIFLWGTPEFEAVKFDNAKSGDMAEQEFTKLVQMDDLTDERRQYLQRVFDERIALLIEQDQFHGAVDLVDVFRRAVGLDAEVATAMIDDIATKGVNSLASDMRGFKEEFGQAVVITDEYVPSREDRAYNLLGRAGISEETYKTLDDTISTRKTEYLILQLEESSFQDPKLVFQALQTMAQGKEVVARTFSSQHFIELIDAWLGWVDKMPASSLDRSLDNVFGAYLRQKDLKPDLEPDLPEIIDQALDNLIDALDLPENKNRINFQHIVAVISPVIRIANDADVLWGLVSKQKVKLFCTKLNNDDSNSELPSLLSDPVTWHKKYWDEVVEYL